MLVCGGGSSGVLCVALTLLAVRAPRSSVDVRLLQEIQSIDSGIVEPFMFAVDQITASFWVNSLLIGALAVAVALRQWCAAMALALLPVARFTNHMLSRAVERERPNLDDAVGVVETTAASFPSGHVIGAVSFYTPLFLMAGRIEHAIVRGTLRGVCAFVIALVGFGRVWYGAHFPSDVLGVLSLYLIVVLCETLASRGSEGTERSS